MLNEGLEEDAVNVFPYSFFYVFYEQYMTMREDAATSLGVSLASVFAVILLMTGLNFPSAILMLLIVAMTITNLVGVMILLGISLNAISLVNLVMSIGISVEFSAHLVAATLSNRNCPEDAGDPVAKAKRTLGQWGGILLAGVHITNLLGVAILAFAKSRIFNVYYFQMYISLVLIGIAHGLILLPVILSYIAR